MASSSEIDISIFVTHPQSKPRAGPTTEFESEPLEMGDQETLLPPVPRLSGRDHSADLIPSDDDNDFLDDSYRTGGAASQHDGDVEVALEDAESDDLVTFEGDEDVELLGESTFNKRVKRESKVRRARSKKLLLNSVAESRKKASETGGTNISAPTKSKTLRSTTDSPELGSEPESKHCPPASSSRNSGGYHCRGRKGYIPSPLGSVDDGGHELAPHAPAQPSPIHHRAGTGYSSLSKDPHENIAMSPSSAGLAPVRNHSNDIIEPAGTAGFRLQMNEYEERDVMVVSEYARPGRPKLERIMREEVYAADGPAVVACEWS